MKMQEIVNELMKHSDEYAVNSVEKIIVGKEPIRKHKKKRIAKKWAKRYGYKYIFEEKPCRKIVVTLQLIIDFCQKYGFPLPEELLNGETNNE